MHRYRGEISRHRRPFWLPASNYYVLAVAVVIAVFFLLWGILNDGREDAPWIGAGLGAAIVLALAVVVREIILREVRRRFLISQSRLDHKLKLARRLIDREGPKLTLERNAAILHEISRKSEAAKVLGRFAEGHREVCELCDEYVAVVNRELPTVGSGSPRIAALRRGTEVAFRYHHYHLLQWAEIESKALTQEAARHDKISRKLDSAQAALEVVDFALRSYPHEGTLLDSRKVLVQLVTSMKVTDLMEKAERASYKGNERRALNLLRDAQFLLQHEDRELQSEIAAQLEDEIGRIERLFPDERPDAKQK